MRPRKKTGALEPNRDEARPSPDGAFSPAPTGTTMTTIVCKETRQRIALLARASDLFERFGCLLPVAIAFLNGWPTEVKTYQEFVESGAWHVFLSGALYQLAAFALGRAVSFAEAGLDP